MYKKFRMKSLAVLLCCVLTVGAISFYERKIGTQKAVAASQEESYAPTMRIAIVTSDNGCALYDQPGGNMIAQLEKNEILSYGNSTLYTELDEEKIFWVFVQKDGTAGYVRADDVAFEKNAGRYALASESLYVEVGSDESVTGFQSADRAVTETLAEGIYKVELFTDAKTAQIQSLLDDSIWYVDSKTTEFEVDFEEKQIPLGEKIAAYARKFLGTPYVWGGTNLTGGVDCSGFVQAVYANFGYSLPRTAASQAVVGTAVSMGDLQPGDLLFYVTAMPNPATGQYDEQYPYAQPSQEDIQNVLASMGIAVAQANVTDTQTTVSMTAESEMLPVNEMPETVPDETSTEPVIMEETSPVTETPTEPITEVPTEPETTPVTEIPTESETVPETDSTEPVTDQTEPITEPVTDSTEPATDPIETNPVESETQKQTTETETETESETETETETETESETETEQEKSTPRFYIGHVTMYLGDGKIIHATGGVGVTIDDISALNAVYACRIIPS